DLGMLPAVSGGLTALRKKALDERGRRAKREAEGLPGGEEPAGGAVAGERAWGGLWGGGERGGGRRVLDRALLAVRRPALAGRRGWSRPGRRPASTWRRTASRRWARPARRRSRSWAARRGSSGWSGSWCASVTPAGSSPTWRGRRRWRTASERA